MSNYRHPKGEELIRAFESHAPFIKRFFGNDPEKVQEIIERLLDDRAMKILPEDTKAAALALAVKLDSK